MSNAVINELDSSPLNNLPTFNPSSILGLDNLSLFFSSLQSSADDMPTKRYVAAIGGFTEFLEELIQILSDVDHYCMETAAVIEYRDLREKAHNTLHDVERNVVSQLSDVAYMHLCDAHKRYLQAVDTLSKFDKDDDWDIQMFHDAEAGLFDDLAAQALKEHGSGKCQSF